MITGAIISIISFLLGGTFIGFIVWRQGHKDGYYTGYQTGANHGYHDGYLDKAQSKEHRYMTKK